MGCGARQRLSPVGAAANGMPLKTRISGLAPVVPASVPASIVICSGRAARASATGTTAASAAVHSRLLMTPPTAAPANPRLPDPSRFLYSRLWLVLVERNAVVKNVGAGLA